MAARDLELARAAYATRDLAASIAAHDASQGTAHVENHHLANETRDVVKSLVYGGLDGITTSLSVVCVGVGANFAPKVVIVMGFGMLLAAAISMGLGDALSEKAELDYVQREWQREAWEMEENPEGEIKEMVELYVSSGVSEADAQAILTTMAKYPDFFVRHMMVVELGIQAPVATSRSTPWSKGAVTFAAFVAFGAVPLTAYTALDASLPPGALSQQALLALCGVCTGLAAFALGVAKSKYTDQTPTLESGGLVTLNLLLAGAAAFLVGQGLNGLVPDH